MSEVQARFELADRLTRGLIEGIAFARGDLELAATRVVGSEVEAVAGVRAPSKPTMRL